MIPLESIDVLPAKQKQFFAKHITCAEELAEFFPRKYYDFRKKMRIIDLEDGQLARVSGQILYVSKGSRVEVVIDDGTGRLYLTWFGGCYFYNQMVKGDSWTFCGKVSMYYDKTQMVQPMLAAAGADEYNCIYPIYSKINGMADKYLQAHIKASIAAVIADLTWDDADTLARLLNLMDRGDALETMHHPKDEESFRRARQRITFNHIFEFYRELYARKKNKAFVGGKVFSKTEKTRAFIRSLPFPLTQDQQRAVDLVMEKTRSGEVLNAMVSGDVGCGKTAVALITAILASENGCQSIIMAPTLVLAKQHFEEMSKMAAGTGIRFALLTSEVKTRERKKILAGLADGTIQVLIGTHSVLSNDLVFRNLGMTIVDEEHRFGAHQKQLMESFDKVSSHHMAMTATPIPRSYAASLYGNQLDLITIETMPAGRKPVITEVLKERKKAYENVLREVRKGHQGYVVCPFIEDSDNERFKGVQSVETITKELSSYCRTAAPGVRVACISGDMKQQEVLNTIDQFATGSIHILVSTTIIEVGVNVPNATAIAIMSAGRFGLSALHQLRGRVGRKGDQGYCYLVQDNGMTEAAGQKLQVLVDNHSGFKIAEMDMKFRGPGDILGEMQTGDSAVIELIRKNPRMAHNIRVWFEKNDSM